MKGWMRATVMVAIAGVVMAAPAYAQDMGHKAGRGLVNVATGWLELPKTIHDGAQEENPVVGVTTGIFKGVGKAVLRTLVGAYEVVTFPVPYPKDYAPVYEPEYVFD